VASCELPVTALPATTAGGRGSYSAPARAPPPPCAVDGFHEVRVVDGLGLLERIGKLLAIDGSAAVARGVAEQGLGSLSCMNRSKARPGERSVDTSHS